jgi:hypothetical protein
LPSVLAARLPEDSALLRHPCAVPLFATRPAVGSSALAMLDRALPPLKDAGFSPRTALASVSADAGLSALLRGFEAQQGER